MPSGRVLKLAWEARNRISASNRIGYARRVHIGSPVKKYVTVKSQRVVGTTSRSGVVSRLPDGAPGRIARSGPDERESQVRNILATYRQRTRRAAATAFQLAQLGSCGVPTAATLADRRIFA